MVRKIKKEKKQKKVGGKVLAFCKVENEKPFVAFVGMSTDPNTIYSKLT
jgi:hypothetical protein